VVALLYATKILEGKWEYKNVPYLWSEQVKEILIAEDREDLIK